jgi:hypothetical protein
MATGAAVVTSFGSAGTRTARINKPGVGVGAGDLLVYTVTVSGAAAAFGFGCQHREVLSATTLDGGQPRREYQWEYFPDDPDDSVALLLSFLAAVKYVVRIDRISAAGGLLETVRDADYESQDPQDRVRDDLAVLRV